MLRLADQASGQLDLAVFAPPMLLLLAGGLYLLIDPQLAGVQAAAAMDWVTHRFGWLFVLTVAGSFGFVMWLAFGRFGGVKLGAPEEDPEFGTASWVAMMFSAGIGIGLVSWAFAEPLSYMLTPPFGIAAGSDRAAEWAHMYALFHWGLLPWGLYALAAIPVAWGQDAATLSLDEALSRADQRRWPIRCTSPASRICGCPWPVRRCWVAMRSAGPAR